MKRTTQIVTLAGCLFAAVGSAWAGGIGTVACNTFASSNSNGTTTFPGTYVGTIGDESGQTCQIGNLALYNGGTGGAFVNQSNNPSIYSFFWDGGDLGVTEQIGNDGIGDAIDVSLFSLASMTSTSPQTLIASTTIPFSSGPTKAYTVFGSASLGAGYYAIETRLAAEAPDPNYQINFSPVAATPEPASFWLLGLGGLGLAAWLRRRAFALGAGV